MSREGHQPDHGQEAAASFAEIAAELGCSKARVQQIEAQALAKVRVLLAQRGYRAVDLFDALAQGDAGRGNGRRDVA